jgi:hypothetical protein
MVAAVLVGITVALRFLALGLGVFVLDPPVAPITKHPHER